MINNNKHIYQFWYLATLMWGLWEVTDFFTSTYHKHIYMYIQTYIQVCVCYKYIDLRLFFIKWFLQLFFFCWFTVRETLLLWYSIINYLKGNFYDWVVTLLFYFIGYLVTDCNSFSVLKNYFYFDCSSCTLLFFQSSFSLK